MDYTPESLTTMIQRHLTYLKTTDLAKNTKNNRKARLSVFEAWVLAQSDETIPKEIGLIKTHHMREYFAHRSEIISNGTRFQDYLALKQFFEWVGVEERNVLIENPMRHIHYKNPKRKITQFIQPQDIDLIIGTCETDSFLDLRDKALLLLYKDNGARATELITTRIPDYNFEKRQIEINGKGDKKRTVPFSETTREALFEYLEVRGLHMYSRLPYFFIGQRGRLGYQGVRGMFVKRCEMAALDSHHLHELRHFFAHFWLSKGGNEGSLMEIMGWSTRSMLDLYGASLRQERALNEYHNNGMSPVESSQNKRGPEGNGSGTN